ncbi:MAG: phosphoribosylformylglycinamidine cyclo-ligase [Candidatus Methanoplasma sp.]|jgi:phosphoribosylformylglycinamidine cyclo-ligase|nr:phosphoribosylformylglycinamidine cyclo-ligase [Candidatus Methanoplasma sp.]
MSKRWTYSKAGVNIDDKSKAISSLVSELRFQRDGIGQMVRIPNLFASLIDFGDKYLTLATDGVGTKLLIAKELGIWNTVGIDCIAMNVNDTICVNSEPVSFVDYIAIDKPNDAITKEIGIGLQKGAELSNMEIVGGEIAVLPEMVNGVDLSGTCLGYVEKDRAITGEKCERGDAIVSLRSTGLHSNGYTLARKVLESSNVSLNDKIKGFSGTIGMEMLTPTEIYVRQVLDITRNYPVHGLVNITGGGLRNLLRMRKGLRYTVSEPLVPARIFDVIQEMGNVEVREMYQTFNMGMGFMIIMPESDAADVVKRYKNADIVGRVDDGSGVLLEPENITYDKY